MYYECDEPSKKNIYDNIKERKHTIKDLHPYRCYRIHVTCESSGGLGKFSDQVEHWTKPGGEHSVRVLSSLCGFRNIRVIPVPSACSMRSRESGIPGLDFRAKVASNNTRLHTDLSRALSLRWNFRIESQLDASNCFTNAETSLVRKFMY